MTAPIPRQLLEAADRAIDRAKAVASEYETVEVQEMVVKARNQGAGIVQAARDTDAEMIVMGAEPPTRIRGGAILGGSAGIGPAEIGPVTEYVLNKAPSRVLVTAPVGEVALADRLEEALEGLDDSQADD